MTTEQPNATPESNHAPSPGWHKDSEGKIRWWDGAQWGPEKTADKRFKNKPLIILAAAILVALVAGSIFWWYSSNQPGYKQALAACDLEENPFMSKISDDGKSLSLSTPGKVNVLGTSYEKLTCTLDELGAPESVITKIGETRALDGRQTDSWGKYKISYTYHPDDGASVIVEVQ